MEQALSGAGRDGNVHGDVKHLRTEVPEQVLRELGAVGRQDGVLKYRQQSSQQRVSQPQILSTRHLREDKVHEAVQLLCKLVCLHQHGWLSAMRALASESRC